MKYFIKKDNLNLKKTYFVAEIGVNHNGNLQLAKKMVLAAKSSNAKVTPTSNTFLPEDLNSFK